MRLSVPTTLRPHLMTWAITGMLPLPILVAIDPAASIDVACIYLGLGCGWLAMEVYRADGLPTSVEVWRAKMLAISLAVATNAAMFILFGLAAGAESAFPFPLKAALSVAPAIGLIPWLVRQVRQPYMAIILASVMVLAAKLTACVIARIRYGPDYIAQGYVAEDWHTAKMMISLFWIFSTALSATLLLAEYARCRQRYSAATA